MAYLLDCQPSRSYPLIVSALRLESISRLQELLLGIAVDTSNYFANKILSLSISPLPVRRVGRGDLTMALRRSFITRSAAGIVLAASIVEFAQTSTTAVLKSGYSLVDGLKMYYEIHGTGEPLILLHGGLGSSDMFSEIMPVLLKKKQVIAVDLQAHGRTADINRPLSYEAMADDVAALIHSLKIEKAEVMGYSVGGEVALRTAIQHPKVVRKLVIVSATFSRDGWYPEIVAGMTKMGADSAASMKQTPMDQL